MGGALFLQIRSFLLSILYKIISYHVTQPRLLFSQGVGGSILLIILWKIISRIYIIKIIFCLQPRLWTSVLMPISI